jgi:hypothetical protein
MKFAEATSLHRKSGETRETRDTETRETRDGRRGTDEIAPEFFSRATQLATRG